MSFTCHDKCSSSKNIRLIFGFYVTLHKQSINQLLLGPSKLQYYVPCHSHVGHTENEMHANLIAAVLLGAKSSSTYKMHTDLIAALQLGVE